MWTSNEKNKVFNFFGNEQKKKSSTFSINEQKTKKKSSNFFNTHGENFDRSVTQ